ncbi:hypothetical protein D3C76_1838850 [compost metagenome]
MASMANAEEAEEFGFRVVIGDMQDNRLLRVSGGLPGIQPMDLSIVLYATGLK